MIERGTEPRSLTDPPRGAAGGRAETANSSQGAVMRPCDVGDRVNQAMTDVPSRGRRVVSTAAAIDGSMSWTSSVTDRADTGGALTPDPAVIASPLETAVDGSLEWSSNCTRNRSAEDRPYDG